MTDFKAEATAIVEELIKHGVCPNSRTCKDCQRRISEAKAKLNAAYERKIESMRADIAQAIGYAQGLGHPNKYLEKRYLDQIIDGIKITRGE